MFKYPIGTLLIYRNNDDYGIVLDTYRRGLDNPYRVYAVYLAGKLGLRHYREDDLACIFKKV
jgi:hypothetical protein